ncbi:Slowpoke-binding protein [Temnothorax longispinosus]|uniref:Slowpoke-binding protein n=1 Tax=Temnothorax longispinosus TaxID=300112 RepID=A0A4S2KDF0_9HYME|nr:Slowpoke-binding protein [Temnothorax longispinosus]
MKIARLGDPFAKVLFRGLKFKKVGWQNEFLGAPGPNSNTRQGNRGAAMFNLYQSLNKKDDGDGQRNRESEVTGHDRFCQHRTGHSSTRRRRRAVNRRTQSATELNPRAMSTARGSLRRGRSVSTEDENESEDDKGHQLANKLDNLARLLFSRVSAARGYKDQGDVNLRATWRFDTRPHRNPWLANLIRFCCCQRRDNAQELPRRTQSPTGPFNSRNGRYTALNHGSKSVSEDGVEYMEMEKKSRDRALSICQDYIGKTSRFALIKQLNNIGSRVDKYWFMVRDTSLKTDRLLTLVPLNQNCPLTVCPSTKDILNNLFLALQHPYICPVFHVDFLEYEDQTYIVLVQPINQGSLKDLIHGIERNCWNEDWTHKYARGKGLTLPQVQRMGRQILEALVFLKERGFPTVTHLHSGNVVIQNGVARLAGLENTLLGFTSRIHPIVTSRLTHATSIDIICFGHMLFEMCAGYELCTFRPSAVQLSEIEMYPQVFRPTLTPSIMSLLDGIKRQDAGKGIANIGSEDGVSLNSFNGSLLTQIYNELSQTAL